MSMIRGKEPQLVIGAAPRIDLMPPEVRQRQKDKSTRGVLTIMVIVAAGAVAVFYLSALLAAGVANTQLQAAQSRTNDLLTEQQIYAEVPAIKGAIATGAEAEQLAVSTQIDWQTTMSQIGATLPSGTSLKSVTATSTTPISSIEQSQSLTQPPHIATLAILIESATLPNSAELLRRLQAIDGFAGAWLLSANQADAGFEVSIVLNLSTDAIDTAVGVDESNGGDK